jgi:hypothetical protein
VIVFAMFKLMLLNLLWLVLICTAGWSVPACGQDELRPPKLESLRSLLKLPDHWRCINQRGIDTASGTLVSTEKEDLAISYLNGLEVDKASSAKNNPGFKWQKSGRFKQTDGKTGRVSERKFVCLLNKENTLFITFPAEYPPLIFSAEVKSNEQVEYAIELVLRHGRTLIKGGRYEDGPVPPPVEK